MMARKEAEKLEKLLDDLNRYVSGECLRKEDDQSVYTEGYLNGITLMYAHTIKKVNEIIMEEE